MIPVWDEDRNLIVAGLGKLRQHQFSNKREIDDLTQSYKTDSYDDVCAHLYIITSMKCEISNRMKWSAVV